MSMLSCLRAGPVLLSLALSACSAFPGLAPDVAVTSTAVVQTPPADEVKDDLGLGKMHFERGNYGLSEMYFRRTVEAQPGQAEAWIGLAASYDQMKRWDLADRAYTQALKITGPTPAFLNNRGYSYLMRGDVRRASQDLTQAAARDPGNEQIQNNLAALDTRLRKRF